MTYDRRELFKHAALLAGSFVLPQCKTIGHQGAPHKGGSFLKVSPINDSIPRRVSWTSLPAADKTAFIEAVKSMKATECLVPSTFGEGGERTLDRWTAQAEVHQWYCSHRNWLFLPWHRRYLYSFEQNLRQLIRDDFRLPYWDWTADQNVPIELQDSEFLKAMQVSRDGEVIAFDGSPGAEETKEWWAAAGSEIEKCADYETIGGDIESSGLIESPYHNMVHVELGGNMGQVPYAGKDPVFWLHHCNVDRLWSLWMDRIIASGNTRLLFPANDVGTWLDQSFPNHFWNAAGSLESASVRSSLFTEALGYNYDSTKKSWDLTDIPSDQASVEQAASVEKVDPVAVLPPSDSGAPLSPAALRLTNISGSTLALKFAIPPSLFDSPQSLMSLRLKIAGIPTPKNSRLQFKVLLIIGGKYLALPAISFFSGAHAAHEGMIGLPLNKHMNQIRSLAKSPGGGQLLLTLMDRAGKLAPLNAAFPTLSLDPKSYVVKWKAVFV